MASDSDRTVLSADADGRRAAVARYLLRAAAHRIASECERMLEHLHTPEREAWREAVGDALIASRHLLGILTRHEAAASAALFSLEDISRELGMPRDRIVQAMGRLLHLVPVAAEDELLQRDARSVRELAMDLLILREEANSESPGSASTSRADELRDVLTLHRILVVDDEQAVRQVLSRMLHRLGHDVVAAQNGRVALEMALRERLDLIITDINMPEMDGMQLLRLLKENSRTRDIPVVVISSDADVRSAARCIEQGAEDHIAKPYDPVLLQARVRALLDRKRMRDLEIDYLRRVAELTTAAEAVEQEIYVPGSLRGISEAPDELGRLARVFDRMVASLRSREERLQHRVRQLRSEMASSAEGDAVFGPMHSGPMAAGETLAGRYEIRGEVGRGGMGTVYRAHDRELGEDIAIKVVRKDLIASNPTLVERLKSEIRLARRLPHRNIVRSHDLGDWNGLYFITMEFVEGSSVKELIDRRGRLSVEATLAIGTQVAEALIVAHEASIIHRDIKPENLLIDASGCLKVTDFGLARPVRRDIKLTEGGFILGTPHYMAPEQFRAAPMDARTDLYAVGVVLYECLVGKTPHDADSVSELYAQVMSGSVRSLTEIAPDVPPSLASIIHQLIERRPADRVPSATELARRLAEVDSRIADPSIP